MTNTNGGEPLITVIVAVLNNADTIGRCLESVERQTYPFVELIVIDGGSVDGTFEKAMKFKKAVGYMESRPDGGIHHAWNKALKKMKGDWACFLGADDFLWEEDVLEKLVPRLKEARPGCSVVYCDAAGVLDGEVVEVRGGPWNRRLFFDTMYFSHQGVMHHKSVFERFGGFDQTFKVTGDYDFLLRCLRSADPLYVPGLILSGYTVCGMSNRIENAAVVPVEAQRARKKNGAKNFSAPLFLHFLLCNAWGIASKNIGRNNANKLADLYRKCKGKPPMYRRGDRRRFA